ncbi:hypothetical protein PSAR109036_10495 [Psychrobacter arenosus]|uniref:hypothetical protein n=1 Tax=Psychrobacter arenosus TaxID=256326 RepID=UPI0019184DF7|nr:hypothetical protein [Psychrobacter arenosus]
MKWINYDELLADYKPQGHISSDANRLANGFIREYCIQAGTELARFLDVDVCFDNHMALRVWVQMRLDMHESYVLEEVKSQLESELYDLLGGSCFSYGYL